VRWYLCTIGRATPGNWALCKLVGLYGIPGGRTRPYAQAGDHLLVWQGGEGYIAEAVVTGPVRTPSNSQEAPWPGGTRRFAYVVPIEVILEVASPLKFPFDSGSQSGTGFHQGLFQRSFSPIPEKEATYVSAALAEKRASDRPEGGDAQTADVPKTLL
jgi:hypothetical protein